jgi:hypothetical protein
VQLEAAKTGLEDLELKSPLMELLYRQIEDRSNFYYRGIVSGSR